MKKKAIFLLIIVFFSNLWTHLASSNIYISVTVDNEIITNHDIKKESEYLKVLNPQLSQLNSNKILKLAKNSLINEIIKKKEISKFIDISKENDFVQNYLNNLYLRLNFENEDSFKKELLKNNNYTLNQIKQKIKIELFWNELIYSKYKNQLRIDEKELKNKINN